jgi:hypothetical protein
MKTAKAKPNAVSASVGIFSGQYHPKLINSHENGAKRCTPLPHFVCVGAGQIMDLSIGFESNFVIEVELDRSLVDA